MNRVIVKVNSKIALQDELLTGNVYDYVRDIVYKNKCFRVILGTWDFDYLTVITKEEKVVLETFGEVYDYIIKNTKQRHKNLLSVIQYSMTKQLHKGVDIYEKNGYFR